MLLACDVWSPKDVSEGPTCTDQPLHKQGPWPHSQRCPGSETCPEVNPLCEVIARGLGDCLSIRTWKENFTFCKKNRGTHENSNTSTGAESKKEHLPGVYGVSADPGQGGSEQFLSHFPMGLNHCANSCHNQTDSGSRPHPQAGPP